MSEHTVDVELSAKEIAQRGKELAEVTDRIENLREQMKESSKIYREEIQKLQQRALALADVINTGVEKQDAQEKLFDDPDYKPRRLRDDDKRLQFPPKDEGGEAA